MSSMPTLKPRLVHLCKQPGVVSFGFNVTATRSEAYRYVGIVVDNSLAKQAGLRSGDRVHEVNGENIDGVPLPDVQRQVAKGGSQVQLLVADPMTDQLYRDNNEVIRCGLPETIGIWVPQEEQAVVNGDSEIETEVIDADAFIGGTLELGDDDDDNLPTHVPPPVEDHQSNGVLVTSHDNSPFKARLCTIKKWPDYQGFGFVLHGDKEEPGQNIGKIESNSPAETAGLRPGDRLIEVNGANVEEEFQQDVVGRIASGSIPGQTVMLVVDPDALRFFRGHGITVHSSMVDIERIETPPRTLVPATVSSSVKVRLCHVKKWYDFAGYGFVLHGEKGTPGTYLTNIDPDSPAEAAGLKDGDKIIEINGVNVEAEEQPQSIDRIQVGADGDTSQARLLVVDPESERYYRRQNIQISGSMADVVYMTNPDRAAPVFVPDPEPVAPVYIPDPEPVAPVYIPDPEPAEPIQLEDPNPEPEPFTSNCRARLCHVKRWSTFDGYGFYLHSEDGTPGVCIGKIDPDSPAEAAGMRCGDRIIEVNGLNVESDAQNDLVQKVLGVPNETRLLVTDSMTYQYFLNNGILINGNMTDVDIIEAPDR